ncbi:uncharacterized protein LOC127803940 isoform X2 [Diospyros lotus]|uniref:uncharacterized protein LOC127803940 isoform X2 n=1 Tax=Diospyros lotus TaxID=55363 RepID=UPI00225538D2|nr:uncharacterized protein LOC127803940 isoform X2 [Diospyros lotus]
MLLRPQSLLSTSSNSRISFHFTNIHSASLKTSTFSLSFPSNHSPSLPRFRIPITQSPKLLNFKFFSTHRRPLRAYEPDAAVPEKADALDTVNLDSFLSVVEFLCLASSAVISVGFVVNSAIWSSQKPVMAWLGNRVFAWQVVLLVGAMAIGALIRTRQWTGMCTDVSNSGSPGVNLIERIEKLEEDIRSSVTVVRALSRKLEKLGIRFKLTRKALKDPLSEEQQQKQLELILAIGKSGKLWDSKLKPSQDEEATEEGYSVDSAEPMAMEIPQIQALAGQKESNSDRT